MGEEIKSAQTTNQITEGVIWKQLLLFFFPILFGTFFQQLYNSADAIIVGRFVGKEALSAVGGTTGSVIQVMLGFVIGISSGATVIISQYYGAKRKEMVQYAVHTGIAACVVAGLIMMAIGMIGAPFILKAMNTPLEVLNYAIVYIRIYFLGIIGNLIYNVGSAILRAVGDSKKPLYFLMASCFTNIVLDVVFVMGLQMGVAGAALATILSQAISAGMVIYVMVHTDDMHHLDIKQVKIDTRMLRRIIRIGFPAGLQSVMYTSSNVIIQTSVNSLGTDTVAAWTAYSKIDCIFWMIVNAFGIAATTFVGQNFGAGKKERVYKGIKTCMIMTLIATLIISTTLYYCGYYCLQLFTTDYRVLSIAVSILKFLVPTYITYMTIEILSGSLRGVGDCWIPTILCFLGVCMLRVAWILIVVPMKPTIFTVVFSYPLTWTVTSCLFAIYFTKFSKLKTQKRQDNGRKTFYA